MVGGISMRKYAQILNDKVHWIMEDEMTLEELYKHKFCKDHIHFVEITNLSPAPEVGWSFDGEAFTAPIEAVPTEEELLSAIRSKRNALLAACDWTQATGSPLSAEVKAAYAQYRQALRDMPATCDSANPEWPVKPQA